MMAHASRIMRIWASLLAKGTEGFSCDVITYSSYEEKSDLQKRFTCGLDRLGRREQA